MHLSDITPLILTWNEEANLRRCLDRLRWAERIVIVDSGSTDETLKIAGEFPQVDLVVRSFDNHTDQWNFGVAQVTSPWVLALDADYIVPSEIANELSGLAPDDGTVAYDIAFRYCVFGKPLNGSLYPPRASLFFKEQCCYRQDGHTQLLEADGLVGRLVSVLDHDDRKPLSRWLDSQRKYAALEADKLLVEQSAAVGLPDRLRKMIWPAPFAAFFYMLFVKRLIFDGWAGWYYVLQRTYAELLLSLELLDRKLRGRQDG